ncbi:MAG TPA: NDP-sugar synthase [Candidatus Dormibacteraeota bacterium]|nr:NDP-sugar synthase [Candidatus Dormibacteraeota bacterium]
MKGLILAGGFATRLRPLSCSKPKLLFPIVGTPLIDHMCEWLVQAGVGQVVLAVNHLSDRLRMEVEARKMGDQVQLSVEDTPLGTGGPLKLAASMLADEGPVVVVNGDVVTDVRLTELFKTHEESGADATIALFSVKDTRPFGLVTLDSQDNVVGFEEKSEKNVGPGWINAGVYILNQSVIEMIPSGRAVSIEREIFPVLASRTKLKGWRHNGFWYDIGKIPDYVTTNLELLERRESPFVGKGNEVTPRPGVEQPSFLAKDCIVEDGAKLGPRVIFSPKVQVKSGAKVHETIVFEETILGENCRVEEAIIGERVVIGSGATIGKGSIIAGQIKIPEGANVNPGSIVLN